jgi:hypothetical protein
VQLHNSHGMLAAGTTQIIVTRGCIIGLIIDAVVGSEPVEATGADGYGFMIDRELGLEFRIKMKTWRDKPADITIRPKRPGDADFALVVTAIHGRLADDGTTGRASLGDLSKAYEKTFSGSW